jgi:NAD(P)-dependent dehydrogenase (short-subunit alcohol dehydrogenase family)
MPLLDAKVALITGAANGIGAAIARLFAGEGARVSVLDIDGAAAEAEAAAIRDNGGIALAGAVDVRVPSEIGRAVDEAHRRYGRIDILINNAGIYPRQSFLDITEEQWDEMQAVNLKGCFHCARVVLPRMIAQKSGKIVNISSVTFHAGMKRMAHYIASKGGVIGLTRALAREFGEHNVHVNCITPGAIETEREAKVATPEQVAALVAQQCLQRRILPLDVARACLFLASTLSDGMTGQTINVDGGRIMY